jgi:hypothetical protein
MAPLIWFYTHCILAVVILIADYNGTLEESLNNFEKKIGLYTPPDTIDSIPPYYIPPIEIEKGEGNAKSEEKNNDKENND